MNCSFHWLTLHYSQQMKTSTMSWSSLIFFWNLEDISPFCVLWGHCYLYFGNLFTRFRRQYEYPLPGMLRYLPLMHSSDSPLVQHLLSSKQPVWWSCDITHLLFQALVELISCHSMGKTVALWGSAPSFSTIEQKQFHRTYRSWPHLLHLDSYSDHHIWCSEAHTEIPVLCCTRILHCYIVL